MSNNNITLICFHPDLRLGERYFITLADRDQHHEIVSVERPDRFKDDIVGAVVPFDKDGNSPVILILGTSLHLEDDVSLLGGE